MTSVAAVETTQAGRLVLELESSLARIAADALTQSALDVMRHTVAAVLHGRRPHPSAAMDAMARDVAEQFVLDANGVDAAMGRALRARAGRAGAVAAITWLGLAESRERLRILLGEVESGAPESVVVPVPVGHGLSSSIPSQDDGEGLPWPKGRAVVAAAPPTLQALLEESVPVAAAIRARLGALPAGPLPARVRELVRLTSADTVDCRYCRNVRYRDDAGDQLVDEVTREALAAGAGGDSLGSPEAAVAVEVARTFLGARTLPSSEREHAETVLGTAAWLDLLVSVQRFPAGSKAMVALGLVPERTPLTLL